MEEKLIRNSSTAFVRRDGFQKSNLVSKPTEDRKTKRKTKTDFRAEGHLSHLSRFLGCQIKNADLGVITVAVSVQRRLVYSIHIRPEIYDVNNAQRIDTVEFTCVDRNPQVLFLGED